MNYLGNCSRPAFPRQTGRYRPIDQPSAVPRRRHRTALKKLRGQIKKLYPKARISNQALGFRFCPLLSGCAATGGARLNLEARALAAVAGVKVERSGQQGEQYLERSARRTLPPYNRPRFDSAGNVSSASVRHVGYASAHMA